MTNRRRLNSGWVLALALTAGLPSACSKARGGAVAAPVPVTVAVRVQRDFPVEIRAIGNVEPLATVALRPQVSGQIEAVHFREGDDVRAGDLLFTIDARPYRAALAQAEAARARDQAQSRNAASEAQRAEDLFAQGVLSREQHDALHAQADALAAAVRADEAAVESARLQLEYCSIRAPIGGRTGGVLVKPGNVVKAVDGGPLVVINQVDPIYVTFSVPERQLTAVRTAAAAHRLEVEALVGNDNAGAVKGELWFVDNQVDPSTGTVRLRARFANESRRLWPGQFVQTHLAVDVLRGAVMVPATAVQDGQAGRYVFVTKPDDTVEVRKVVVGPDREGEVVVLAGIVAGETVVTDGQVRLLPGSRVAPKAVEKAGQAGGRS